MYNFPKKYIHWTPPRSMFISYLLNIVKNACAYYFLFKITRSFKDLNIINFTQLFIKKQFHILDSQAIFFIYYVDMYTPIDGIYNIYVYICMYTPVRISNPKNRYWIVFHQMVILSSYTHLQYYISYLNPPILYSSNPSKTKTSKSLNLKSSYFNSETLPNLNPRFSLNLVALIL